MHEPGGAENEANADATSSAAGDAWAAATGVKWKKKSFNYKVVSLIGDNRCRGTDMVGAAVKRQ